MLGLGLGSTSSIGVGRRWGGVPSGTDFVNSQASGAGTAREGHSLEFIQPCVHPPAHLATHLPSFCAFIHLLSVYFPSLLPLGLHQLWSLGLSPLASLSLPVSVPAFPSPTSTPPLALQLMWSGGSFSMPCPAPCWKESPGPLSSPLIAPSLPMHEGRPPRLGFRVSSKLGARLQGFSPNVEFSDFHPKPLHTHLEYS